MIRAPFMPLGYGVALTAALFAGAGCKKAAKPAADAAPVVVDAPALAIDAAAVEPEPGPLTPPVPAGKVGVQVLGVEYEGFEAKLLPAIRDDGALFAALWIGDDGGRGYLHLKLQFLDAKTSAIADDRLLVDPDETMGAQGEDGRFDPKMLEAVVKRVADANAVFATGDWRALKRHVADPADPDVPLVAAGITWTLDTKYRLVGTRAGKKVFERTYTQLTRKQPPRDHLDDEDPCPTIITLAAIHVDEASSQALVAFGRQPGHNCGAPGDDLAVIALPR